jgi:hypothetical protein
MCPSASRMRPSDGHMRPSASECAPQPAVCARSNPDHPTWQRCGSHHGQSKSRFTLSKVNKTLILIGRTQTLLDVTDETDRQTHRLSCPKPAEDFVWSKQPGTYIYLQIRRWSTKGRKKVLVSSMPKGISVPLDKCIILLGQWAETVIPHFCKEVDRIRVAATPESPVENVDCRGHSEVTPKFMGSIIGI